MKEKRGGIKGESLFGLFILIVVGFMFFVFASTINSPVTYGNYSGTMNFSCNTTLLNATNASLLYNASGGAATISLNTTIVNSSAGQLIFENMSVDISGLSDGAIYNMTCLIVNVTNSQEYISIGNVRIDNTAPNVSNFYNTINNGNYSGTIVLNASVDDITGVDVYFNITNSSEDQHNFTRALNSGIYYNITLITTVFTDGLYNITVWANNTNLVNGSGDSVTILNSSEKIQVTIDNTAPYEINFTSTTVQGGNYSGNMVVNVSVLDATAGVNTVFFNITNSTGQQNATYTASKAGNYYSATIDTSAFPDGDYNITVWANDTAGNLNNSKIVVNLSFDNTAPTGSMTCTPESVNSGSTVTCSCGVSDTGGSGVNTSATSFTANPSTSNTGTFTETCSFSDYAGNAGSASDSFIVSSSGSGSTSGGGGGGGTTTSFYTKTIPKTSQDFSELQRIETSDLSGGGLKAKERLRIMLNEQEHYIGVRELTSTSAVVEITSDPLQVNLNVGEETKADITNDGFYDIYVRLNRITGVAADLTIRYLHEEIVTEEEGSLETTEKIIEPEIQDTSESKEKKLTWLWWTIGFVFVVGVAIFFLTRKKGKKKKRKKLSNY